MPLIAVLRKARELDVRTLAVWVGTVHGPERGLVEAENVPFHAIPSAKLPRYPSVELLKAPVQYFLAGRMARQIIRRERPDLVVTAGAYVGVPVIRAAAKEGIVCALHQLDWKPTLSNRLVAHICRSVTTSFVYANPPFGPHVKSVHVKTPCRFSGSKMPTSEDAKRTFGIAASRKVIFILGGGTGARAINEAIRDVLDELLVHADVIHSTGKGKATSGLKRPGYHPFELMQEMSMRQAYAASDVVICRAGIGTLSELAALSKASIVVPIPRSHQETNARALQEGIIWLHQTQERCGDALRNAVKDLLTHEVKRNMLGSKLHQLFPTDDGYALAEKWMDGM